MIEKGYEQRITDNWESYRYNSPWTIASLRTNEVAIELKAR